MRAFLLICCAGLLLLAPAAEAQLPAWDRWWTIDTPHFRVHYAEGLEEVARRSGAIAEEVHARLAAEMIAPPRNRIEMVVTDHTDFANGWASPVPRNRIVIFARQPTDEGGLAHFDEWLHLVIGHELVHIFQLDHAESGWIGLRRLFGRSPLFFPHLSTPGWLIEGLATHRETDLTGAGRVHGTHFDMMLRTAALEDALFPIDRVTGVPTRWPGGISIYAYGAHFFEWLAAAVGEEAQEELIREIGRMPAPYLIERPARRVLGESFRSAWERWREVVRDDAEEWRAAVRARGETVPEILVPHERSLAHPRYLGDGSIVFVRSDGRRETHIAQMGPERRVRRLAPRTSLDAVAAHPMTGELYWTDLEYGDRVHILGDLFRTVDGGGRHRITRGARLRDLDISPTDGTGIAIRSAAGADVPALVDLESGAVTDLFEADRSVHWLQPRWAPDGSRIAVARWRAGIGYDIAIVARDGRLLDAFGAFGSISSAPAWSPDGGTVIYAADELGTMNLYAREIRSERDYRVTNVVTGAFQPDVSPDGRWIAFAHYSAAGYGLARVPFAPDEWNRIDPVRQPFPAPPLLAEPTAEARPYRALDTALPTSWLPLVAVGTELGFGAGIVVGGTDAIGRHQYTIDTVLHPGRGHLDAGFSYLFEGLRLGTPRLSAGQRWSVWRSEPTLPDGEPVGTPILRVNREISASLALHRPGMREVSRARIGLDLRAPTLRWADESNPLTAEASLFDPTASAGAFLSLAHSNARRYALSISSETGHNSIVQLEGRRYLATERAPAAMLARVQGVTSAYLPIDLDAFARHVLAGRLTGGIEAGEVRAGFSLGGIPGESARRFIPGLDGEVGGTYPLRGYPTGVQVGDRVVSGSLEFRAPLAFIERGIGTVPIFLDRVWGSIFVDGGTAWCGSGCPPAWGAPGPEPLASTGAEMSARTRIFYHADIVLRLGGAIPLRSTGGRKADAGELYLRVGHAF